MDDYREHPHFQQFLALFEGSEFRVQLLREQLSEFGPIYRKFNKADITPEQAMEFNYELANVVQHEASRNNMTIDYEYIHTFIESFDFDGSVKLYMHFAAMVTCTFCGIKIK